MHRTTRTRLAEGVAFATCLGCVVTQLGCRADTDTPHLTIAAPRLDSLNPAVFVPGGTFVAGSDDWDIPFPTSSPYSKQQEDVHTWTLDGFWMQKHEVTNEEYARFDAQHRFPSGTERRPVAGVTWPEAMAYARALGGSLPNEVQWEFAARGPQRREYPWGNQDPSCTQSHYLECEPRHALDVMGASGDITPHGIHDLAGNVREWVTPVWFDLDRHPVNHDAIKLKGGSFAHPAFFLRAASVSNDFDAGYSWDNVGFRVAWTADEPRD